MTVGSRPYRRAARVSIALFLICAGAGCRSRSAEPETLRTHYLLDYGSAKAERADFFTTGHLIVFNPGETEAQLDLTAYFEDIEPVRFQQNAAAGVTTESNSTSWPLPQGRRFALEVQSSVAVVCQATVGWSNTGGDFSPGAHTSSPRGVREAAKSYMSIRELAPRWLVADGIVLDGPQHLWIRESEWALMLNPGDAPARVTLSLHGDGWKKEHLVEVPSRRLRAVYMDDVAPRNQHYGIEIIADKPVAAQWVREVRWYDSPEVMAFWSVPAVPQ